MRAKRDQVTGDSVLKHPLVQEVFADPRYRHLSAMADHNDPEPEQVGYDRVMTLEALAAIYTLRSAEKQGQMIARATWALVGATVGLVLATAVLVVVTVRL